MSFELAKKLEKGQQISLKKLTGEKLEKFCVKVSWGAIKTVKQGLFRNKTVVEDVDLDLSSILVNAKGDMIDWLYSPEYNEWLKKNNLPLGKLDTSDHALHHSGDDLGKGGGDDFSEIITVDLTKVNKEVNQIFFFLNIYLNQGQSFDFSDIPFARIEMYEGSPNRVDKVHLAFDISTDSSYSGKLAIIMGKLYYQESNWKFDAIGDETNDKIFLITIQRILKNYVK